MSSMLSAFSGLESGNLKFTAEVELLDVPHPTRKKPPITSKAMIAFFTIFTPWSRRLYSRIHTHTLRHEDSVLVQGVDVLPNVI